MHCAVASVLEICMKIRTVLGPRDIVVRKVQNICYTTCLDVCICYICREANLKRSAFLY
jgi:hypothetical protein